MVPCQIWTRHPGVEPTTATWHLDLHTHAALLRLHCSDGTPPHPYRAHSVRVWRETQGHPGSGRTPVTPASPPPSWVKGKAWVVVRRLLILASRSLGHSGILHVLSIATYINLHPPFSCSHPSLLDPLSHHNKTIIVVIVVVVFIVSGITPSTTSTR